MALPSRFTTSAVVIIADLMAAGDQAAIPLRCGHDIDVPDIMLKAEFGFVSLSRRNGQAARMLTPGPMMSGFKIPGLARLGPLDEKEATTGAYESPMTVPLNNSVAVGVAVEFIIIAAPPALLTSSPLAILPIPPPLSQATTLPLTLISFNDPSAQNADSDLPFMPE
ncbi:hypothetical protein F8388_019415 [Cannabis sativa]|uniref:Uncharacterized protein n=1 Tax=Cannabis sativa TaxID=3483 RepID=A0A7J6FFR8_CANSA|nr:hypothetical protein F8388_019415 [Cannabis sativa]